MELNFEVLEMEKRNIKTDRAQGVNVKKGVIYLFITVTLKFMLIKMSKWLFL